MKVRYPGESPSFESFYSLLSLVYSLIVEDRRLEEPQDSLCLSDIETSAARYPARFAPETAELLEIWEALEEPQRAELLALARDLSSRPPA